MCEGTLGIGTNRRSCPGPAHLVGSELQGHHLGQHVQGALGGTCEEGKL